MRLSSELIRYVRLSSKLSELIRYVRLSSKLSDFLAIKNKFFNRLRNRGYPNWFLSDVFSEVRFDLRWNYLMMSLYLYIHARISHCTYAIDHIAYMYMYMYMYLQQQSQCVHVHV